MILLKASVAQFCHSESIWYYKIEYWVNNTAQSIFGFDVLVQKFNSENVKLLVEKYELGFFHRRRSKECNEPF